MPTPDGKSVKDVIAQLRASGFSDDQARALAPGVLGHTCLGCPALMIGAQPVTPTALSGGRPAFGNAGCVHGIATACRCMPGDTPNTFRMAWGRCPLYGLKSVEELIQRQDDLDRRLRQLEAGQVSELPSFQCARLVAEPGAGEPDE